MRFRLLLGVLAIGPLVAAGESTIAAPVDVFAAPAKGEKGPYAGYRIPAICRLPDGTLLAFAEARVQSLADNADVDLVQRRSTDGGRTWEPMTVVADVGPAFIGNAAPVVDRRDGSVAMLVAWKAAGAHESDIRAGKQPPCEIRLTRSTDGGRTWSALIPAPGLADLATTRGWRWNLPSPCHGIQLAKGPHAGRLVVAGNHSSPDGAGNKYLGAHALLSDDGGRTWSVGAVDTPPATGRTGPVVFPNESTVAEWTDGTLVFHTRDEGGPAPATRGVARSTDAGATFTAPFAPEPAIVGPVCQGALLTGVDAAGKPVLLASLPADPKARKRLVIRCSRDGGATWEDGPVLHEGGAAYSDLVELGEGRFLALAELDGYRRIAAIAFTIAGKP